MVDLLDQEQYSASAKNAKFRQIMSRTENWVLIQAISVNTLIDACLSVFRMNLQNLNGQNYSGTGVILSLKLWDSKTEKTIVTLALATVDHIISEERLEDYGILGE